MEQLLDQNLLHAIEGGNISSVHELVQLGANPHFRDEIPLITACYFGNLHIVKYLIEQGADSSIHQDRPLCFACEGGHLNIVKYLVEECKANIHTMCGVPISWALYHKHYSIVEYLESKGACYYQNCYAGYLRYREYTLWKQEWGQNWNADGFRVYTTRRL